MNKDRLNKIASKLDGLRCLKPEVRGIVLEAVAEIVTDTQKECSDIARAEYDYWRGVTCTDVPGLEYGACVAALNISDAILLEIIEGMTVEQYRVKIARHKPWIRTFSSPSENPKTTVYLVSPYRQWFSTVRGRLRLVGWYPRTWRTTAMEWIITVCGVLYLLCCLGFFTWGIVRLISKYF